MVNARQKITLNKLLKSREIALVLSQLNTKEFKKFSNIKNSLIELYKNLQLRGIDKDKSRLADKQIASALKNLQKVSVIEKKKGKHRKDSGYRLQIEPKDFIYSTITRFTDNLFIESYLDKHIIGRPGVTYYGLKSDVFSPEKNSPPEYQKLFHNGLTVNDLFEIKEGIGKGQLKKWIGINDAFRVITEKLLEIKKEHRFKVLKENFEIRYKKVKIRKLKVFLRTYENVLLHFLNHTDCDEDWIKKHIFVPQMFIVAEYDSIMVDKFFVNKIIKFSNEEKNQIIEFLFNVFQDTSDLYPTDIVIVCKTFKGKIMDEYKIDATKYLK